MAGAGATTESGNEPSWSSVAVGTLTARNNVPLATSCLPFYHRLLIRTHPARVGTVGRALTEPSPSGTEQGPEGGLGWSAKVHAARPPVHSGPVALAWLAVAALDESSHRRLSCEIPLEFLIVHDPKLILESEVTLRPGR